MSPVVIARLHERARRARAGAAVRRWEYRQRHHAHGVWFRLTRLLADAAGAWRISEGDAARLVADGIEPERVGFDLEPAMTILVVPAARLDTLTSREPLRPGLEAELLTSRCLALVRWP